MPSNDESSSGWWKPVLIAIAAVAAAAAAVIAWGRATPLPETETDSGSAEAEPSAIDLGTVDTSPTDQRAPSWVKPTILWTIGLVVAVVAALALLGALSRVVTWILLALFFSFALEPGVNRLVARGWRRGSATGLLLGISFLLLLLVTMIFIRALLQGAQAIADQIPDWSEEASAWVADTLGIDISTQSISEGAENLSSTIGSLSELQALLGATASLIGSIFDLFTVGMFLFYMVAEGPKFKRAVLAFLPRLKQEELVSIWEAAIDKTGGYFYSKGILMLINGGLFFVVLRLLDVPGAAPLALFQGFVAEFIPIVGTYIAAIVPLTVAFFSIGMPGTLILLIYVLIYQQVENYLLSPRLQSKTMELHPAVAFGAALAGGAIGGILWAFLAVPFAATVQASASIWFERHEVLETEFTKEAAAAAKERTRTEDQSLGKRAGRWLRSSRGWLRRKPREQDDATAEAPMDATPGDLSDLPSVGPGGPTEV